MRSVIIGAGQVGTTLGQGWTRAGHQVCTACATRARPSRKRAHRWTPCAALHPSAMRSSWLRCGRRSPTRSPPRATSEASAPRRHQPIGPGFALTHWHTTSGAEQVASLAKNARVVKAFHSTGFENMSNPRYGERRLVMPIAGDDAGAVDVAARLATDLGFEVVKLEPLTRARDLEPLAMLWIKLALQWGQGRGVGFAIVRRAAGVRAPERKKAKNKRTITVVGAGSIGGALARAWLLCGHDVRLAARDAAASDVRALAELGAKVLPVAGSAEGAEVVVFAVPAGAVLETAKSLGNLDGKIVVDCTNAIAKGLTLQYGHTTSWSEEIAKALPGAKVVRSFNQQGAEVLQNPLFSGVAATNFVASDFDDARKVTKELASDVGLDAIEVGPLSSARYLEALTLLWIAIAQALGTREFGLSLLRR